MLQMVPEPPGTSFETRFCEALLRMRAGGEDSSMVDF
jgi:hypothetical protein